MYGRDLVPLSTIDDTDMTSQIGALELGDHMDSHSDGPLEATAMNPPPISTHYPCVVPIVPYVSDGALERVGSVAPTHHLCPTVGSICSTAACPYD
jgi:hypothetical protein